MTYLWVQYVWTLNHLLGQRRYLWGMLTWLESGRRTPEYAKQLTSLQSSPFVDAWVEAFVPTQSATRLTGGVAWALMGSIVAGVAAAIGLAHACVFAILDDVPRRWPALEKAKLRVLVVTRVALCVLLVCTYEWFERNNHDWWFSIGAAWFVFIWVKLRRYLPGGGDAPEPQTEEVPAMPEG